jgi:hypothetical protein
VFVLLFTADVIPAVAEFVFALITAASDAVAIPTRVSVLLLTDAVPAVIAMPSEVEAVKTVELVLLFTALAIPAVALLVFALITAASDVDAVETVVPTVVTSD